MQQHNTDTDQPPPTPQPTGAAPVQPASVADCPARAFSSYLLHRPEINRPGFVYAAYSEGNGCKVGKTCQRDPMLRVVQFNTCVKNPYALVEAIHCSNPSELEKFMHKQLKGYKVGTHNRELFDVDVGTANALFNKVRDAMHIMGLTEGAHAAID
eukprot:1992994-Rhodomonas_salina.1